MTDEMKDTITKHAGKELMRASAFDELQAVQKAAQESETEYQRAKAAYKAAETTIAYEDAQKARKEHDSHLRELVEDYAEENPGAKLPDGLGIQKRVNVNYEDRILLGWLTTNAPTLLLDVAQIKGAEFTRFVSNIVDEDAKLRWMELMPATPFHALTATVSKKKVKTDESAQEAA